MPAPESSNRTTISVRRSDAPTRFAIGSGVVRIDGQRAGWMVGGRAKVFRVLPGRRRVQVQIGLSSSPEVVLDLAAGEHVGLACRGQGWLPWDRMLTYLGCYLVGLPIALGLAYLFQGLWHWFVLETLNRIPFGQASLPSIYRAAPFLASGWTLVGVFTFVWLIGVPGVLMSQPARTAVSLGLDAEPSGPKAAGPFGDVPDLAPADHLCVLAATRARQATRPSAPEASGPGRR